MTDIEISQGDTEEIIPNDQANREYIMSVEGSAVRVGHSQRYAKEGTEIQPGDRIVLSDLRSDSMFAFATDGDATITIDEASANIRYMPRAKSLGLSQVDTVTEVQSSDVSDRSAREIGKARVQDSSGTLIDPAKDSTVSSEQPRSISSDNVGLAKDSSITTEQPRSVTELQNESTLYAEEIDVTGTMPDQPVPDGQAALIKAPADNGGTNPVVIGGAYELSQDDPPIEVYVDNLNTITIDGDSGDVIHVLIPGGT